IGVQGHAKLFANMMAAIDGKESLLVDGIEGRRSVEIILAIYKAAESGQTVMLPLASDPDLNHKVRQ
ncbi:MAG: Gfo/Idh/MocA family protein, partial [Thermoguttaceae bacterium]